MQDGLDYIREAIAKGGASSKVEVIRWEKDQNSGYYSRPFKVLIKADIALQELEKPLNKRSTVWQRIRPIGVTMDGNVNVPQAYNRLNSPDLIEQLKAELRVELAAEMKAEIEKAPKKKKKAEEISEATIIEEPTNDLSSL